MKNNLAEIFRFLLKIPLFKNKYFSFHKYLFHPYHLFSGVKKQIIYRNTIKINVRLDDWIQQQIYFLGEYEKPEIDYLYETLKPGSVFVDVGANIGLFSLNASNIVGLDGKVIAFEAFKPNYIKFNDNIKINNFTNIIAENKAISNQNSTIEILYNESEKNVGMASTYLKNFTSKELVECFSLDHYLKEKMINKVDLIKIDIEGGEFNALLGMNRILSELKPKVLIEINQVALENSGHSENEIIELFKKYNYKMLKKLSVNSQSYNAVFGFSGNE